MTYYPPTVHAAVLDGSFKRANKVWIYSDGTYVTAQGSTLSVGWHECVVGNVIYEYQDWDPANGPPPLDPPPATVRNWLLAWDNEIPSVSPANVAIAATDFSFVNPDPVTAIASWNNPAGYKSSWRVLIEFWSEENGLIESLTVPVTPTSVESDAVYNKDETIYAIISYQSDGGNGTGSETSHLAYPGSTT